MWVDLNQFKSGYSDSMNLETFEKLKLATKNYTSSPYKIIYFYSVTDDSNKFFNGYKIIKSSKLGFIP